MLLSSCMTKSRPLIHIDMCLCLQRGRGGQERRFFLLGMQQGGSRQNARRRGNCDRRWCRWRCPPGLAEATPLAARSPSSRAPCLQRCATFPGHPFSMLATLPFILDPCLFPGRGMVLAGAQCPGDKAAGHCRIEPCQSKCSAAILLCVKLKTTSGNPLFLSLQMSCCMISNIS